MKNISSVSIAFEITVVLDKIEYNFYGTDKDGRPIRITRTPSGDLKEIFDKYTMEEWLDLQVMVMERVEKIIFPICSQKVNKPVSKCFRYLLKPDQFISIVDLSEFSIGGVLDSKFKEGQKKGHDFFELNYPNASYKVYLINTPTIFQMVWKAFSWFLSKKTIDKIHILGDDYLGVLQKDLGIGAENLPVSIGGKNPIAINDYENFWDKEVEMSYKEQRLHR